MDIYLKPDTPVVTGLSAVSVVLWAMPSIAPALSMPMTAVSAVTTA